MAKCPAPQRIVSQVVDASRRQEFLENASVIVLDARDAPTFGYLWIWRQEISQTNWRLGPDPLWDTLWTKFRRGWRIVLGTVLFQGPDDGRLAEGAPICDWIAVQFDSDEEWMRFKMLVANPKIRNPELSEAGNAPPPAFDPSRIIPCPSGQRAVTATTDEGLAALPNSLVVYEFEGLAAPMQGEHLTKGKIGFASCSGRGCVTSDGLFDYLHTKYRYRWQLYINTHSFLCSPKLAVKFQAADDVQDFLATWPPKLEDRLLSDLKSVWQR